MWNRVCGNCRLYEDGRCKIGNDSVPDTKIACFHIGKNYEDRGFESELLKVVTIDWEHIIKWADEIAHKDDVRWWKIEWEPEEE